MEKRSAIVKISDRKADSFPTQTFNIEFEEVADFEQKVDEKCDEIGFGKVNILIDNPEVFDDEELDYLALNDYEF